MKKSLKDIQIKNKFIGYDHPCFIIAEAGVNHNGRLDLAKKLVDAAAKAGVDAVKFQFFEASKVVTDDAEMAEYQKENLQSNESQVEMLKKLELNEENHKILKDYAEKKGLIFLSTPHSGDEAVDALERMDMAAYKIGSGDLTNKPFLEHVAKTQKPIFLSTGMATMPEVKKAIEWIRKAGNDKIIALHCTSNYPCPYDEVNMNAMKTMMNELDCLVGYSDHTIGTEIPILARAMGACLVEKHYTLDKNMEGPDHKASADPEELKFIVKSIRNIEKAFGWSEKKPNKSEKPIMDMVRKSLVADKDIKKGKKIEPKDIFIKRPGTGIQPEDYDKVIGKKAKADIKKNKLISWEKLE